MVKSFKGVNFQSGSVKKYRGAGTLRAPANKRVAPPKVTSPREDLLKDVNKRLNRVENKLDRHEAKGVKLIGSMYDPRRNQKPANMNTKQLAAYKAELEAFMSRNRQYLPDAFGNPVPAAAMREYKMYEKKYNRYVQKEIQKIADVKLPHMNMTLGERMDKVIGVGTKYNMTNGMNHLSQINRDSGAFFDAQAVGKAIANLKRKITKQHTRTADSSRASFEGLAKYANRPELGKLVDQLTDEEFLMLADFSSIFADIKSDYEMWKKFGNDKQNATEIAMRTDDLFSMVEDQMRFVIENRNNG